MLTLPVPPVPVRLQPLAPLGALAIALHARELADVLDIAVTNGSAAAIHRASISLLPAERAFVDLLASLSRSASGGGAAGHAGIERTLGRRVAVEYRIGSSDAGLRPPPANTQLMINVTVLPDVVRCAIGGSPDTIDPRLTDWLIDGVELAYRAAAANPETPLSALPVIGRHERERIRAWAGRGRAAVDARCLPELFADQVALVPDAVALRGGGIELTFSDLDTRSSRLVAELLSAGARPRQIIAVCLSRSIELVVALLAIVKLGAAYLALEPSDPPRRLAQLIAEAAPALVVTHERYRHRLPASARCWLLTPQEQSCRPRALPDIRVDPDDVAYVSFTSGSTGRPKGVCVPHRAVARLVIQPDWISVRRDDVFLQLAPVAFDASTLEIWAPLTNGATLAVHPAGPTTPDAVAATLRREQVTVLWLTAGLFHRIVDDHVDAISGLRHLLAGGEVLSAAHVRRLRDRYPGLTFTNGYGPTENTTFTTCWTTTGPELGDTVPIGRPINGTRVAILDEHLAPVPAGVAGELYATGDGLAHGYLGQPDRTASRFIPDPEPERPGDRMYRTGDLARWRPDGLIDFVGRVDTQIKLNGHRVEPGEIEAVLRRTRGVLDTIVIAETGANGERRLIAYIVPDPSHVDLERLPVELSTGLRAQLPPYLVPSSFVLLPAMPLTDSGKVNRSALPRPEVGRRTLSTPYTPPRTELEAMIADTWQRTLGVNAVGIHDDFFELGGHSLMAADLVREMQQVIGTDFPAQALYLRPTIAELACLHADGQHT